ncbi:MAG: hypothetical protein QG635_1008, partial [Bacteroidota bacterium]|nr:hypothetical protein [Bacteroidota bacterium]
MFDGKKMKYVFKLSFLPLIFFIYLSSAFGQPKMIVDLNDGAHREYMLSELRTMQLQPANQSSILQIFKKGYDCVITPSGIIDSVYFDFIGADSSLMSVSYAGIINSYKLSEIDSIKFSSVSYADRK